MMDLFIKDNLKIITFMVLVFINGLMAEFMMENGKITKCMEEGNLHLKIKKNMMDNISKMLNMDLEL